MLELWLLFPLPLPEFGQKASGSGHSLLIALLVGQTAGMQILIPVIIFPTKNIITRIFTKVMQKINQFLSEDT